MWNKSIFKFEYTNEYGEIKSAVFITETFQEAKSKFEKNYPNETYFEFMEFNDKKEQL